jgi:hypothetical protein
MAMIPFRKQLPSARGRKLRFVAGILLVSTLCGCTTEESIRTARREGAKAGFEAGVSAGDAAGYEVGFKDGENAAYKETLNQLYATADYRRVRSYSLIVLSTAFLLGFCLQYVSLYLLRRNGFLYDIDRIILGRRATQVDLTNLSEPQTLLLVASNEHEPPSPD